MPILTNPAPVSTVGHARGTAAIAAGLAQRLAATVLLMLAAVPAVALGLGDVARQSPLGSPLRIVVPIILGPDEELFPDCVRLANSTRRGDGLPEVSSARVVLERSPTGTRAVISSDRTVTEPVLRLTLQVGCEGSMRREYVLLFDPPAIETPVGVAAPSTRAPVQSADVAGTPARASAGAQAPAPSTQAASKRRPAAGPSTRGGGRAATAAPRARPAPPAKAQAAARAPQPKLSVSASAPIEAAKAQAAAGSNAGAGPSDARAALEAEAAALQDRVVEMTALVDKMQSDLKTTEGPRPPPAAAPAPPPPATPPAQTATTSTAWYDNWPLIVGGIGIVALMTAWLLVRVRRAATARRAEPPPTAYDTLAAMEPVPSMTPPAAPAGARSDVGQPVAATPAVREAGAPETAAPRLRPKNETTAIDVEELSHVTEEAGVYLHFNRPDAAINVLRDHIARTSKSLPAAWLMLLDLYYREKRELDFRDLAEAFHSHFNVRAPDWDGYGKLREGETGGLESFPHLVRELTALWGKPECQHFLEELLYDKRDGQRMGFSLETYEDIVFLLHLLEARH